MDRLKQLSDAIEQGLSAIDGVQHCGLFPKRRDDVRLPAILLDLIELEPGKDPGTGELELISHWEARVIVSDSQPKSSLWALVQAVMLWLFNNRWSDLNIGRAILKQAGPDHFSPEYQGHQVWLVEWTQSLRVGEDIWDGTGIIPTIISVGWPDEPRQDNEVQSGS